MSSVTSSPDLGARCSPRCSPRMQIRGSPRNGTVGIWDILAQYTRHRHLQWSPSYQNALRECGHWAGSIINPFWSLSVEKERLMGWTSSSQCSPVLLEEDARTWLCCLSPPSKQRFVSKNRIQAASPRWGGGPTFLGPTKQWFIFPLVTVPSVPAKIWVHAPFFTARHLHPAPPSPSPSPSNKEFHFKNWKI